MVTHRAEWSIADRAAVKAITGDGLMVAKDDDWRFQREMVQTVTCVCVLSCARACASVCLPVDGCALAPSSQVNPLFHFNHLLPLTDIIMECTNTLVDRLHRIAASGEVIDIHDWFRQLTLDVMGRAAFGQAMGAQTDRPTQIALIMHKFACCVSAKGHTPHCLKSLAGMKEQMLAVIRVRRADVEAHNPVPMDLLTQLLESKDADTKKGMNDLQVLAEMMTFLFGGTAACVCVCVCLF